MEFVSVRRRLPVWAIVMRSYGYVWDHRILLAIPIALVFGVQLASAIYVQDMMASVGPEQMSKGLVFLISAAVLVFSMSVIVGIHRTVLLDETRRGIGFLRLDGNLLRYIGTWLMLMLVGILLAVIFMLVAFIGGLASGLSQQRPPHPGIIVLSVSVFALVIGILFLRFMLALPAAAVGSKDGLGVSWSATSGNWLRLVATGFLTFLPFVILNALLLIPVMHTAVSAVHDGLVTPVKQPIAILIASSLIKALDLAVLTVMLSLTYDVLVRGGGPTTGEPPMTVVD